MTNRQRSKNMAMGPVNSHKTHENGRKIYKQ
jgi:hypothetical protein